MTQSTSEIKPMGWAVFGWLTARQETIFSMDDRSWQESLVGDTLVYLDHISGHIKTLIQARLLWPVTLPESPDSRAFTTSPFDVGQTPRPDDTKEDYR